MDTSIIITEFVNPHRFWFKRSRMCASVKRGALRNILPTSHFYRPGKKCVHEEASTEWNNCIITELQHLMQHAEKTYFTHTTTHMIAGEEIEFGDLWFLTYQQKLISAQRIVLPVRIKIVDEKQFLKFITSNSEAAKAYISEKTTKTDTNVPVAACSKELASITTEPLLTYTPNSQTDLTNTPDQLECVSNEQLAANQDSEQALSQQHSSVYSAKLLPRDVLKLSRIESKTDTNVPVAACSKELASITTEPLLTYTPDSQTDLTNTPGQLECVSNEQLAANQDSEQALSQQHSSVYSAKLLPRDVFKIFSQFQNHAPVHAQALKACQQLKPFRKRNAFLSRATSNATAAVNSTTIEAEEIPSSLETSSSVTEEQNVPTSESSLDGSLNPTDGNKHLSVADDSRTLQRFLNAEQCELSHLRHHRILVDGSPVSTPIVSIEAANFCQSVHQALQHLGVRMVYRLQAYAWPNIMRGNSLLCINSARTGKTLAYLPAVCSIVKMNIQDNWIFPKAGPVGIIVCPSSKEVQRIGHLCRRMLNSLAEKNMSVLECYGLNLVKSVCNKLLAGCAILVTTAPAYRRMYEAMPEAFVRNRIKIVVLDNMELMLPHSRSDLKLLCKNMDKSTMQMIATAGHWDRTLRSFQLRYNMVAMIGAYLEAAVYAKTRFQLRLQGHDCNKQNELARYILKHDFRNQRTVVFGSTADDLAQIVDTLRQYSIQHHLCSVSTSIKRYDGFRHWDDLIPGKMEVLVCLDEVLSDLRISKAQHILHYSLPDSWTSFTRRFATAFKYFGLAYQWRDMVNERPEARPSTLVLLDQDNNQQLPKLIDFLELHHVEFPAELSTLAQNIRYSIEYERVSNGRATRPLCPQLLAVADCRSIQSCIYRHILIESDLALEDSLPAYGSVVRLKVCHLFSPVHFSARLEARRVGHDNFSWTTLNNRLFRLHDIQLQAHFANPERHQMYGKAVILNELCALFHEQNYYRCRIVHFEAEGDSTMIGEVQLKLIDTGRMVNTKSTNLLFLPEQFHAMPEQTIQVRIAGVVPIDSEEEWDQESTEYVKRLIDNHVQQPPDDIQTNPHYVQGKVLLALRDTIWIDELMLIEQLESMKTVVVSNKIKSSIVSKQFGVYDRASLERIQQMVQKFGAAPDTLVLPNIPTPTTSPKPEDAHKTKILSSSCVLDDSSQREQIDEQSALAAERSLDSAAVTNKQTKCVVHDPISHDISVSQSRTASPERQTPLEGKKKVKRNNHSISSSSSFEILSPTQAKEEYRFEALEKGKKYEVIIGQYFAPDLFYVYQKETMLSIHEQITAYTANASNIKQLTHLQVGVYCLFYFEDAYRRSQIVELGEKGTVCVFLMDVGGTIWCYPESLFEIPNQLLRDHPFAAVEAKLGLIEPLQGSTWTEQISNAIYDDVLAKLNENGMVAHVLQTLGPRHEACAVNLSVEECHRYELLLIDPDSTNPYSIISELAQNKLAMVHWEDESDGSVAEDEEEDDSFVQLDFTQDELRSILHNITNKQSAVVAAATAAAAIEQNKVTPVATARSNPIQRKLSAEKSTTDTTTIAAAGHEVKAAKSTAVTADTVLPRLECDYRFPSTVWWQDDCFIMLYVSAPDVIHYQLTVNIQSVLLQFIRDDQRYVLPLNLFGPIDPEHTMHEVRGLTIVIRLARLPGSKWRWPTLLNYNGRVPWLKKAIDPPPHRRTSADGCSESEPEPEEYDWCNLLPSKLNDMFDSPSNSSQGEQYDEQHPADAMEDEIFYSDK